jgi:hypothetical protein
MAAVTNLACAVARYGPVIAALLLAAVPAAAQQFERVPAPAAGRSALPARAIAGGALLAELRKGGYVIYYQAAGEGLRDRRARQARCLARFGEG